MASYANEEKKSVIGVAITKHSTIALSISEARENNKLRRLKRGGWGRKECI